MTDPNAIYKLAFAELSRELGRVPTSNELLGLHDAYKRAWGPAEETVTRESTAAGRPGFSRQPAPQARTEEEGLLTREEFDALAEEQEALQREYLEALSGPTIIPTREEAESVPDAPSVNCGPAEGLTEGDRGPGGGLIGKCVKCGRLWERPVRTGRPSIWCEECR